ncbi:MAG TPA: hypothetical protein PLW86_02930, partial [Rhodocyclaceae bacterium]|nr:hypothetical protein [Rhodocyclaceae bacterium]
MIKSQFARRSALFVFPLMLSACVLFPERDAAEPPVSTDATVDSVKSVTQPASCPVCQPCAKCPAVEEPAVVNPLRPARWGDLPGWADDDLKGAWSAFLQSCRGLASKPQAEQWRRVCTLAQNVDAASASAQRAFF